MTSNGTSGTPSDKKDAKPKFDPKFPAAAELKSLHEKQISAHTDSLSLLADLSIPVAGQTAKPSAIDNALADVRAQGETINFFSDIFSRYQQTSGKLSREELDQKLINWALKIPGLKEKFDTLPDPVKKIMNDFKDADLSDDGWKGKASGFRLPCSPKMAMKMAKLKQMWDEQTKADGGNNYDGVVEGDGSAVLYVQKFPFENWGDTVKNTPAVTFIPRSVVGVQNIVKYAKEKGKKVRCSGYRHSWSDIFTEEDEILISLLPLDIAIDLPTIEGQFDPGAGLLQQIQLLPSTGDPSFNYCKIGTATTNEQFREWCLSPNGGQGKWTLPLNVIMVEITFGGSVSPICHGAGLKNQTLSDLVVEVEFVDPNGNLHTVSDPEMLKAAAGAFGLLGVVTAYTIKLDKMTYPSMRPFRCPVELAIPPPQEYIDAANRGEKQYKWIKDLMALHTKEEIDKATADFIDRAENDYYAEWFWFPLQRDVWVNTWKNDGDEADARDIPDEFQVFLQWLEEWIAQTINEWGVWQAMPGELQAKLLGFLTLLQLPNVEADDPTLTTQMINGLHFRRGIQNMQVYDMEWEIPISPLPAPGTAAVAPVTSAKSSKKMAKKSDKEKSTPAGKPHKGKAPETTPSRSTTPLRDWSITQKAWWDGILAMKEDESVVRIALEMRVMGGSNILMAPQKGNDLGTCSIEVLTTPNTPQDEWFKFCQKLSDQWNSYTDKTTGKRLLSKPHWCKQWTFLTVPDTQGVPMKAVNWIQWAYKLEIKSFMEILKKIGEAHGFTTDDLKARFGDKLLENVFWGDAIFVEKEVETDDKSRGIINKIKKWLKKVFS